MKFPAFYDLRKCELGAACVLPNCLLSIEYNSYDHTSTGYTIKNDDVRTCFQCKIYGTIFVQIRRAFQKELDMGLTGCGL